MGSRTLTAGERGILQGMYGSSINVDVMRIYDERWVGGLPGSIMAPDGNVYFAPSIFGNTNSRYRDDFSTGDVEARRLFVHEMHHVWEAQNGINVLLEGLSIAPQYFFGKPYDISSVPPELRGQFTHCT